MSFQKLRGGLQLNVAPAPQQSRAAAVERLRSALATSGVFADVEVEPTADGDRLVVGLCRYSAEHEERHVVDRLARVWAEELRLDGWDAHSFLVDEGHVEMQAATVHDDQSHYLSLHLVAQADPDLGGRGPRRPGCGRLDGAGAAQPAAPSARRRRLTPGGVSCRAGGTGRSGGR